MKMGMIERLGRGLRKAVTTRLLIYIILIIGALVMIFPFYWMGSTSFKSPGEVFRFPPTLIPEVVTLQNYTEAITVMPMARLIFNTLIVAGSLIVGTIFISSLAGFALARLKFRGKNVVFLLLLVSLMIPAGLVLIPNLIITSRLGLFNSLPGIILPYIAWNLPIPTLLMMSFFLGIPPSLEDAARIDGCSTFKIYYRIMLPLAKPMIATVVIFTWLYGWDELMWALTVTSTMSMRTFPVGLAMFKWGPYQTAWGPLCAASAIGFVFIVFLFLALQKYFMPTGAMAGIKG